MCVLKYGYCVTEQVIIASIFVSGLQLIFKRICIGYIAGKTENIQVVSPISDCWSERGHNLYFLFYIFDTQLKWLIVDMKLEYSKVIF